MLLMVLIELNYELRCGNYCNRRKEIFVFDMSYKKFIVKSNTLLANG